LFGDECRRTQRGNNNAYCQDNEISWFDWRLVRKHRALRRFVQTLIAFRKAEPAVRRTNFLTGKPVRPGGLKDVSWYNPEGGPVDWKNAGHSLVCLLAAVPLDDLIGNGGLDCCGRFAGPWVGEESSGHHLLMLFHAGPDPRRFSLPAAARDLPWRLFINTANKSPHDIYPRLDGPAPPPDGVLTLESRSLVVYVAPADY